LTHAKPITRLAA